MLQTDNPDIFAGIFSSLTAIVQSIDPSFSTFNETASTDTIGMLVAQGKSCASVAAPANTTIVLQLGSLVVTMNASALFQDIFWSCYFQIEVGLKPQIPSGTDTILVLGAPALNAVHIDFN